MSDPLMEALFIGAGAFIGSKLGRKYLGPEGEKPMWNGHINNDPRQPAVIIGQVFHHGKTSYRLYIASEGDWALVGESEVYAEILALLQSWEAFIANGGTINAWRLQNEQRAQETASMEGAMQGEAPPHEYGGPPPHRGQFVSHTDGTVEDER